jgi:hypothetical protein
MVSLARPRRVSTSAAAAVTAPAAAAPLPLPLRGGFSLAADADGGFCVRGPLAAPPSDAPAAAAHARQQPRALPFSTLSRALFARISSGPLFELAAKVAPATCVPRRALARLMRACTCALWAHRPKPSRRGCVRAACADAVACADDVAQAPGEGGGALQRCESARRRALPLPLAGACAHASYARIRRRRPDAHIR